jgi:hypothetical protein
MYNQATGVAANHVTAISNTQAVANFTIPEDFELGEYTLGLSSDFDGWLELTNGFRIVLTGVEEPEASQPLKVYPNPARDILSFESKAEVTTVAVMDLTGKQTQVPLSDLRNADGHTYAFDVRKLNLSKGIYFLKVETGQGTVFQKILIE